MCSNEKPKEHIPNITNIMWCRDSFKEQLNEIEALNDIKD